MPETFPILCSLARERRAMRTRLAKWQITAQHRETGVSKRGGNQQQQLRLTICSRTVREHERIAVVFLWYRLMKKPSNSGFDRKIIEWDASALECHSRIVKH
jgi:hypothetical protein